MKKDDYVEKHAGQPTGMELIVMFAIALLSVSIVLGIAYLIVKWFLHA